jgi:hypothetical protein
MKGKRTKPGFTNEFLLRNGCEPGSCIEMTENSFMTDAAWVNITSNEARALELALTVFSVVQEIRRNNIDSHRWFTLLVKRLRGRVGMSEAMDLACG